MRLFSIFMLILFTEADAQPIPCKPGAQMTINQTACHITADPALNDRIILLIKSMKSFTVNFIDGTDTESKSANSTLLKLAIYNDTALSTCRTANGSAIGETDGNNYDISPIGRIIMFSIGFYGNESIPTPKWNIEDQEMSRANTCQIGLKPYGKYMQLYFDRNTNYQIYSAIKCVKK